MIQVITLLMLVIGGLHFALTGIGIDLLGQVFGTGKNLTVIYLLMGVSTLYHGVPMLKNNLKTL